MYKTRTKILFFIEKEISFVGCDIDIQWSAGAVMSMYRMSVSGRERAILLIKKDQT